MCSMWSHVQVETRSLHTAALCSFREAPAQRPRTRAWTARQGLPWLGHRDTGPAGSVPACPAAMGQLSRPSFSQLHDTKPAQETKTGQLVSSWTAVAAGPPLGEPGKASVLG